jgi:hypothetical protein
VKEDDGGHDMSALQRLMKISSDGLCGKKCDSDRLTHLCGELGKLVDPLVTVLSAKNGCVAFEGALLLFPTEPIGDSPGLFEWNEAHGWRRCYSTIPAHCVFFAQDIFACQFGIMPDGVIRLNAETGEISAHSGDLNAWAAKVLEDYEFETGWSVGKEWQNRNGPLPLGWCLLGRRPFVLGGEYKVDNMVAVRSWDAMAKLSSLYQQIRDVPDGQQITIEGWVS